MIRELQNKCSTTNYEIVITDNSTCIITTVGLGINKGKRVMKQEGLPIPA